MVAAGGRHWRIHCAQDDTALLAFAEGREPFPFGLLLWESAVALADELANALADPFGKTDAESPDGPRVLEIGCGVGLAGLAAAHHGGQVTMTDHDALSIDTARMNAAANGIDGVTFIEANWSHWHTPSDSGAGDTGRSTRYDLVIGADVIYDQTVHDDVLGVIAATLAPGGLALLADPCRHHQPEFIERARAAGFSVATSFRPVADLRRPGKTVDIALIFLRRTVRSGD